MNEPPGARLRVALSGLAITEYFRDDKIRMCCSLSTTFFGSLRLARKCRRCSEGPPAPLDISRHSPLKWVRFRNASPPPKRIDYFLSGSVCTRRRLDRSAPATTFAHLDATIVLDRAVAELGIYPAVDPLASTSRALAPDIVGEDHYNVARRVQAVLQRYKDLQDIIAILGLDELSPEDKLTVSGRVRFNAF